MIPELIDVHTHLGDLLRPCGGALISRKKVRKKHFLDALLLPEWFLWAPIRVPKELVVLSGMVRNDSATLQNMQRAMDRNGVGLCVTMPVPPNVTFEDLSAAGEMDSRVLAFTGLDFQDIASAEQQFARDVARGAKGLKLHPILQKVPLESPETYTAVEAFAPFGLPILVHGGECEYYLRKRDKPKNAPHLGDISGLAGLVEAFPETNFIVGHAGLGRVNDVMERFAGCGNVYVDISFQDPAKVTKLIETLGPERVMYASDWPWGNMSPAIQVVEKACGGDAGLERRLFSENAAELLNLTP